MKLGVVKGPVLKYGDDIDTDVIIPARYLVYTEPEKLAEHAMEPLDPEFPKKASKGVVLVAGRNFGMGSSREQAAIALKAAGVKAIIAKSFSRIFYRNAINNGLPVIVLPELVEAAEEGDEIEINLDEGVAKLIKKDGRVLTYRFPPFRGVVAEILATGGLLEYMRRRLAA
ncbi:3-isopropylmalate dehydratase, small subunit [Pyrolobus fumarii 1A]|uniref:3-isopropylmalate dehydratase small subunit n=1 Tax=Pyrolobus fumarii (strain DSM 11204 / 1A) TaxID=694429 RepID=G0EDC8_PYRF1|nr:3-isopropylmalate dehydratase small subunit [Pyrolobus fumarii]AEM38613.1 3-isopropylmalate dehydratase, small subunit [Pyrolobus fumarii 1A]